MRKNQLHPGKLVLHHSGVSARLVRYLSLDRPGYGNVRVVTRSGVDDGDEKVAQHGDLFEIDGSKQARDSLKCIMHQTYLDELKDVLDELGLLEHKSYYGRGSGVVPVHARVLEDVLLRAGLLAKHVERPGLLDLVEDLSGQSVDAR